MIGRLLAGRPPRPEWVTLDAGHDCAVVELTGLSALTVDTLVEGVHFDGRLSPADVGFKAVAVSVSDLVATRARPRWMVLALSLPGHWTAEARSAWVDGLAEGLAEACAAFGVHLIGGDVTRSPSGAPAVVSSTLGGACVGAPRGRSGARPGDVVWVTGWPGLAGAGWMSADPPPEALAALRRPTPPVELALALEEATAAMDLSDGLGSDVPRLAEASGVQIALDAASLPVHPALVGSPDHLRWIVSGGDDYQLLFTANPGASDRIRSLGSKYGIEVHAIGRVSTGSGARLIGAEWPETGFSHFGADLGEPAREPPDPSPPHPGRAADPASGAPAPEAVRSAGPKSGPRKSGGAA